MMTIEQESGMSWRGDVQHPIRRGLIEWLPTRSFGGVRALLATLCTLAYTMGSATAAEVWHSSTVKWVYPQADGITVVIVFDTESTYCTSAATPKYYYAVVGQNGMTADGFKTFVAMAMTALVTDKRIHVAFEATSPSCMINREFIER
jgi:hypothetical protein